MNRSDRAHASFHRMARHETPTLRPRVEVHRMNTSGVLQRSVLCISMLLLGSSLSPVFSHADEGQVTGVMVLTPTNKLNDVASGAVEDTLKACLARIPDMASVGQRMLAERTCHGEDVIRKTNQGPPQF